MPRSKSTEIDSLPKDLLTTQEAARLLRVSKKTIERMAAQGELGFYELPIRGGLRFSRGELLAWLQQRYRPAVRR